MGAIPHRDRVTESDDAYLAQRNSAVIGGALDVYEFVSHGSSGAAGSARVYGAQGAATRSAGRAALEGLIYERNESVRRRGQNPQS
ncbi:MAG: hypothetical protein ACJAYU_004933 [Bradymonadia bacterium]|jgi:hypothetical protein